MRRRRAEQLAAALKRMGIAKGDRVSTFCWNHQQNLEAYWAIPCMGAVNHTLNIRLIPDQLAFVINHPEERIIIVDDVLIPGFGGSSGALQLGNPHFDIFQFDVLKACSITQSAARSLIAAGTVARQGSKTTGLLELLKRPSGVTGKEPRKATGWQPHSIRGFLSGTFGKKMGLNVVSITGEDGERSYSIKV